MQIPKSYATSEFTVKGSRFLSEIFPIASQADVKPLLKSQKQKYSDATHVVHAFIAGKNAEVMGMSDDGEPGGTAGRPVLDVLKGRNCTNILLTVTRWFGGTLLGTGGLVHAYGEGAKQVLNTCEFEDLIEKSAFSLTTDYADYQVIKKIFEGFMIYNLKEDFGEGIKISGEIATAEFETLAEKIKNATNGKNLISHRLAKS